MSLSVLKVFLELRFLHRAILGSHKHRAEGGEWGLGWGMGMCFSTCYKKVRDPSNRPKISALVFSLSLEQLPGFIGGLGIGEPADLPPRHIPVIDPPESALVLVDPSHASPSLLI